MKNPKDEAVASAKKFIAEMPSDTILRNLAFWMDLAINKGHYIDVEMSKARADAVSESDQNSES